MARILVVEPVAQAGVDVLTSAHETDVRLSLPRAELLAALSEEPGWDALVVRSQTRVDAEVLRAAAPRLSVIGVASIGTDKIDLDAATRAGVMVVNAPTGNTIAAAEHTMALMLALLRQVPTADASVREGAVGAGALHRIRAAPSDAGDHRPGKDRQGGGTPRERVRDARAGQRPLPHRGAGGGAWRTAGRAARAAAARGRHHRSHPADRADPRAGGAVTDRRHEAGCGGAQRGARRHRGRGGARRGAASRTAGRCRGGCLQHRADGSRQPAA